MSCVLKATDVTVRLGAREIVTQVSFSLAANEVTALVGPNGAGKTTLLRALAGLLPAQGAITLSGHSLADLSERERARSVSYLPQGHIFSWPLDAATIVALGRLPHGDPFGRVSDADKRAVREALAMSGAAAFADRPVTTLSGGERARVALARALATRASLLLADEPTASLDPRHQLIVMELLRSVAKNGGAVLAVVHDLALAARFCDRVLVMADGRIVADAPPAEALSPARIAQVFGVEAAALQTPVGTIPLALRPLQ